MYFLSILKMMLAIGTLVCTGFSEVVSLIAEDLYLLTSIAEADGVSLLIFIFLYSCFGDITAISTGW